MKVIAIIPARGGSKGIPKKNIVNFSGKPLIQWTIEAALKSKYITNVVVSSDDDEILNEAKKHKNVLTLKRPKELAQDNSRTEPVLTHVLDSLKEKYKIIILLQPTSPLRTSKNIDEAYLKFINSKATSLISVTTLDNHPYKTFKLNKNGYLTGIINNEFPFYPRQALPIVYKPNGAIYIVKVAFFEKKMSLFSEKTIHFEMSVKDSLDIDTLKDLEI